MDQQEHKAQTVKLIKDKSECIGKRIKAIQQSDNDEQLAIVFDDETFIAFRSTRLDDDTEISIQYQFDPLSWQFPDLEELFGKDTAMSLHRAEVERREESRRRSKEAKRARLQEELRQLDSD